MAKLDGFKTIKRQEPLKRPVSNRLKDYNEIYLPLSEKKIKEQAARCMDCGIPFCHGFGCPLENLIPEFNDRVYKKHWKEALVILQSKNPFPEITGRICPALCEAACVCGIDFGAVSIKQIELAIIEKAFKENFIKSEKKIKRNNKKVAIIGSGPAGLAAAYKLNDLGFDVTVYEKNKKNGGILYYGIPDFKLEKWIVQRRIDLMKEEGINFINQVNVGEDISISYLKKFNDFIVLAGGSLKPRDLSMKGRDSKGIYYAMDYLTNINRINNGEEVSNEKFISAKNKIVVVLGGGDTGADCVGTANRQGAKEIYQFEIMPQPPKNRNDSTNPWPYYPNILRTSTSHEEGCVRKWNILTKEVVADKKGNVKQIIAVEIKWYNEKNKMKFKEVPNSKFKIKCDLIIIAAGFDGHGNNKLLNKANIKVSERDFVIVDDKFETNNKNIFACGDIVSGPTLVVTAMKSGLDVAEKINEIMKIK